MTPKTSSRILTDHDEIRRWAEERGAKPAAVRSTSTDDSIGIIRLDFPGYSGEESLEEIDWDEWFDKFDENNLALVVQDHTANGQKSNFNKLVSRQNVDGSERESETEGGAGKKSRGGSKGSSTRKTTSKSTARKNTASQKENESERRSTRSGRKSSRKKAA